MGDAPDVINFTASKARKHRRIARWKPLAACRTWVRFTRVGQFCRTFRGRGEWLVRPLKMVPTSSLGGHGRGGLDGTR
jgi:hypothetical protein